MQEFTIGRSGDQPFDIKAEGVSDMHARVTIDDAGNWMLQDLKGAAGNGTFIKNEDGQFVRVSKCKITERTIIRLADGGHYSFTFMAHRLLAKPNDYSYEFDLLQQMNEDFEKKESDLDKTLKMHGIIAVAAPIVALCITCLPLPFLEKSPLLGRVIITASSSLVNACFLGDKDKPKALQAIKRRMLVCPKCGRPMSDFDLNNRSCYLCKAK